MPPTACAGLDAWANLMGVAWGQKYSLFTGEKPKEKKIKAKSVPLIQ